MTSNAGRLGWLDRCVSGCRCLAARDASTAVEYAVVLPVVLGFVLGGLDLTLLYTSSSALLKGVQEATRAVRTGELKLASNPTPAQISAFKTSFKQKVCTSATAVNGSIDCSTIVACVANFTSWGSVTWPTDIYDANGAVDEAKCPTSPGSSSSAGQSSNTYNITTARVSANYNFITPGIQYLLGRTNPVVPIVHTTVVVVEPYGTN